METKRRSIVKALSWRFFATIITTAIVWALTGEVEFAATVGVIDTILKLVVYFMHERIWVRIPYGKPKPEKPPEYQI